MSTTSEDNVEACERCFTKFTILKRKHHCRACGKAVCYTCSPHKMILPHVHASEPQKVCFVCKAKEHEIKEENVRNSMPSQNVSSSYIGSTPVTPVMEPKTTKGYPWELPEAFNSNAQWVTKGTHVKYKVCSLKKSSLVTNSPMHKEFNRIVELANYSNPNFLSKNARQITQIDVVVNDMLEQRFVSKHELIIPFIKKTANGIDMNWKKNTDATSKLKQTLYFTHFRSFPTFSLLGKSEANLTPAWHGLKVADVDSICETGMFALSKLDSGWFGKGMYFTHFPEYAFNYTKENVLLLAWVIQGISYPVTEDPKGTSTLQGKPCISGYHSHYVAVKNYKPIQQGETAVADEIVIFQEDQILPRYIVYFEAPTSTPPNNNVQVPKPIPSTPTKFIFTSPTDTNGILYHLGLTNINVQASSMQQNTPQGFISREQISNWTANVENAWFCVDLGPTAFVCPTNYTLRYASTGNSCCPRNWILQGSNEPKNIAYAIDDKSWTTLCTHTNDTSLNSDYAIRSWTIPPQPKYFRYFRIVQTGKNSYVPYGGVDTWSNVLVASHFELYGSLSSNPGATDAPAKQITTPTQPKVQLTVPGIFKFRYQFADDNNGLVSHVGAENISVTSSTLNKGTPVDFLAKAPVYCWTVNKPNSWFRIDLGTSAVLCPSYYTIGYGSGGNYACFRNWKLQGSDTGEEDEDPSSPYWYTIKNHTNDASIDSDQGKASFALNCDHAYRYFRVIQTGKNKYKPAEGKSDDWSDVFVASHFELYGTLFTGSYADGAKNKLPHIAEYNFASTSDTNGVVAKLGASSLTVTCSAIADGKKVQDFLNKGNLFCWTTNAPNSWFCVDLGSDKLLSPNYYTFQYGSSGNYACPRNWELQGSNNYSTWITIRSHSNDPSIDGSHAASAWPLDCCRSFRYFRLIQTGKNKYVASANSSDAWSDVFVAAGFEIYGTMFSPSAPVPLLKSQPATVTPLSPPVSKAAPPVNQPSPVVAPTVVPPSQLNASGTKQTKYTFNATLDTNGIIYNLGSTAVTVSASGIGSGEASRFISREKVNNWTTNKPYSWYMVDFGANRSVHPTYYTLGYGSSGKACCPRNWKLQGANALSSTSDNVDDGSWTTLRNHSNDTTLDTDYAISTWSITTTKTYRYFRIIQTGPNAMIGSPDWVNTLVCNGFELYGTLYEGAPLTQQASSSLSQKSSSPVLSSNNIGNSSSNVAEATFKFAASKDNNGVLHNLGNECITVSCSEIAKGTPASFIDKSNVFCWTTNQPNSWFCVDLGPYRKAHVNYYTLCYGSSGNLVCPRNWVLEATNNEGSWITLRSHANDTSINSDFAACSWPVTKNQYYRYFRIRQTGKNGFKITDPKDDAWSDTLVAAGFEIYGSLQTTVQSLPFKPSLTNSYKFGYTADKAGIIAMIGTSKIAVTCSNQAKGNPLDFVNQDKVFCWTTNDPGSWFCVDFGQGRAIQPTHYTLGYGSSGNLVCPRNWVLQGSNSYNTSRSVSDGNWVTIRAHNKDTTLNSSHAINTWPVFPTGAFRYFRIIQHGKNGFVASGEDAWSNVLVVSGFELYGTVYTT